jgi:hypothetical protein
MTVPAGGVSAGWFSAVIQVDIAQPHPSSLEARAPELT